MSYVSLIGPEIFPPRTPEHSMLWWDMFGNTAEFSRPVQGSRQPPEEIEVPLLNRDVLHRQYPVVVSFVRHLAYARGLKAAKDHLTDNRGFWGSTASTHLGLATVPWCKVFGANSEKTHWEKTLPDNIKEQACKDFNQRILAKTGLTPKQWRAYHKQMLSLRNTFVVHLDLQNTFEETAPSFDTALQVANAYQEWGKAYIKASVNSFTPVAWEEPAFSSQYEQWKAEAASVGRRALGVESPAP